MSGILLANLDAGVAIVGSVITIVSAIGASLWAVARKSADVRDHGRSIDDHETRLRTAEEKVTRIDANVSWIKHALENALGHRGDTT